jgi:protein-S-isoprenylcysteine O-methyltransferase
MKTAEGLRMSMGIFWEGLLYAWVAFEAVIALATRTRRSQGAVRDRGTQLLIWAVIVLSFFASGWVHAAYPLNMPFNHSGLRLAAVVLFIAGLLVRIVAIVTLGRSFSANVAILSTQTIQRSGLYRVVRHPSYLGMEMIFIAVGLYSHDWGSFAVIFLAPTLALLYRIHVEEAALLGAFGQDYSDYMRSTKRLIPGLY